jgi:hypothetical protein
LEFIVLSIKTQYKNIDYQSVLFIKKMKTRKSFALIASLFLFFNCCKEDQECLHGCGSSPKDTIYCTQEFLPYWYFKKGSLWIYQRTDTSILIYDTAQVIYNNALIDFTPSRNSVSAIEYRVVQIRHSDSNFWSDFVPSKSVIVESDQSNPELIWWEWSCKKIFFYVEYSFKADRVLNVPYKVGLSTTIITPVYTFDNTIPFINEQSGDSVYITKGVGMSKFIAKNETWELVSFKIEP